MRIVHYPEGLSLADYLAKEQEIVQCVAEPTIFTWVVPPTVIYGRHQSAEAEVNEEFCHERGIAIVQRKSGGGCVYADRGNLMVSFISPSTHSLEVFDEFLTFLSGALRRLGYDAVMTHHNDVLVGDRKVSGTACYTVNTGTIVHACMLYDVDLDVLEAAITPSADKLAKHGVASVRQRVRNLREIHDHGNMESFRRQMETAISESYYQVCTDEFYPHTVCV
ncbi:MAG: lipoate--protein ligase family protein [Paludibacteraceae bacterium]|nr:lipoate--protein ligase family protein [Paludibacteraceae bacterium]